MGHRALLLFVTFSISLSGLAAASHAQTLSSSGPQLANRKVVDPKALSAARAARAAAAAAQQQAGEAQAPPDAAVTPTFDATTLVQTFLGPGATLVGTPTYVGGLGSAGTFSQGALSGIPVDSGILLTTGLAADAFGINIAPLENYGLQDGVPDATVDLGLAGDTFLSQVLGLYTYDAGVLTFTFQFDDGSVGGDFAFEYSFGSEEYIDYVGSYFEDIFVVTLDSDWVGVSINTVNPASNPSFYLNNVDNGNGLPNLNIQTHYDGLTVSILVTGTDLTPGTHTMSFRIADTSDPYLDAGVFIGPGDFCSDRDGDGICDHEDACKDDPNNDQDGDGKCANEDNCPLEFNPGQEDEDGDGMGNACTPIDYAALGDSYSSGEGNPDYFGPTATKANGCHRSFWAYSTLVQDPSTGIPLSLPQMIPLLPQYEPLEDFLACSGAVTANVRRAQNGGMASNNGPPDDVPQLDRTHPVTGLRIVNFETDLVTLTIGGNDTGFEPILRMCIKSSGCQAREFVHEGQNYGILADFLPNHVDTTVRSNVRNVLQDIKNQTTDDAAIVLAGYPLLLSGNECGDVFVGGVTGGWGLDAGEQTFLRSIGNQMNIMLGEVAAEVGVHFVNNIPTLFGPHDLCTNTPPSWIHGLDLVGFGDRHVKGSFHPTQRGQLEYANAINAYINSQIAAQVPLTRTGLPKNPAAQPFAAPAAADAAAVPIPEFGTLEVTASTGLCLVDSTVFGPTQVVTLSGDGFLPNETLSVTFDQPGASTPITGVVTGSDGSLSVQVAIPAAAIAGDPALFEVEGTAASGTVPRLLWSDVLTIAATITGDPDGDGVPEVCDNCPAVANPGQEDADFDGRGDACDACPLDPEDDFDGDGLCGDDDPDPYDVLPCRDLIDNDGDSLIDLADPGCRDELWTLEDPQCNDGIDNDGQGDVDLADPGCIGQAWRNLESPQCQDGIDNDNDGLIDLADGQCANPADNAEACGLGPELVVLLPLLWAAHRARRRRRA